MLMQAIGINLAVEGLHRVHLRYAISQCQLALRGLGLLPLDNTTYQEMIDVVQYVEGAAEFCAGCMSAIDMYNRRKGAEKRRLEAIDERFRIADMIGRFENAAVQTDDGFDEMLLKNIASDISKDLPLDDVVEEEEQEDAVSDNDEDGAANDVASAKAFDAAADSAFAFAAAAFTDIRYDDCGYDCDCDNDHDLIIMLGLAVVLLLVGLTTMRSAHHDDAFFTEVDVAAAAAAADGTMGHLQLQQQSEEGGGWEGISDDEELPPPPALQAMAKDPMNESREPSGRGDAACEELIRLINAAGDGDAQAMDRLVEALEV
jgi:hypothetical protein